MRDKTNNLTKINKDPLACPKCDRRSCICPGGSANESQQQLDPNKAVDPKNDSQYTSLVLILISPGVVGSGSGPLHSHIAKRDNTEKVSLDMANDKLSQVPGLSEIKLDTSGNILLIFQSKGACENQATKWANIEGVKKAAYPDNSIVISKHCGEEILERLCQHTNECGM